MSVREYIGARYIPVFADPIQWDPTLVYEPLTVVTDQGASYVSRRYVPEGIQLDNTDYWVLWADFNAQLQHYIDEVNTFDGRIDALEDALPIADFSSINTIDGRFDALEALLPASAFDSVNTVDARFDLIEADDWVTSTRIADSAVATAKIANGAVTESKIAASFYKKYANFFSPEQYGAAGDGITDDTQAFKDMLDAMGDGDICILQSKSYKITDTLDIDISYARFTSYERSENKPVITFDFEDFTNKKCLNCTGTGNTFSNIHFAQSDTAAGNYLIYIDCSSHNYNVDYTIDSCILYRTRNAIAVKGRNLHVTNCLFSAIVSYSITVLQPTSDVPLRGFVIDNNRFHNAGVIVDSSGLSSYDGVFNFALVNNFIDYSKCIYNGISDNVTISGNTIAQTTVEIDYLIKFSNTINAKTSAYIGNNSANMLGSPTDGAQGPIAGLCAIDTKCKGIFQIAANMFYTQHTGNRAVILMPSTTNTIHIIITGNIIHTEGTATPIQIVNSAGVTGLISDNSVTTASSASFISATGLTIVDNYTGNLTF